MNPTRKRRLWILLAVVLAAGAATALIAMAPCRVPGGSGMSSM